MRLSNARIVMPNKIIERGHLIIQEGRIKTIQEGDIDDAINCQGATLFPGFIDMHMHGSDGCDFMDATETSINTILHAVLKEGVTSVLATTMTADLKTLERVLKTLANYDVSASAKLLGIHLEGPFINPVYPGAQKPSHIIQGSKARFEQLQQAANNKIKMVTLAPEVQEESFLKALIEQGVVVSMGHSNATFHQAQQAYDLGIKRVTHCYNAMTPIHHRDIGLAGASLLLEACSIELIADLHHVSPPAIKLAHKLKKDHIELVTDSIRAKNMPEGSYDLGGQTVHLKQGTVRTEEGVLAGSVLHLNEALKNMKETLNISDIELAKMCATNQAQTLKLDHMLGKLEEGYIPDITVVDRNYQVLMTIVDGKIQYKRGTS